jgi:hypothetical protein
MADGYNNVDYAFTLPNYFPSPGQVLQSAIAMQERRAESDYENQVRAMQAAQKKAADDRMKNLGILAKETDFGTQYATPDLQVNSITQKELQNVRKEAESLVGESPEKFQNFLNTRLSDLVQWNNMAKTDATNIKAKQSELNSTFPNIDLNKANTLVSKAFLDNYTELDQATGELKRKNYSSVVPNKNYFEQFDNPKTLAPLVNDTSGFYELMKGIPTQKVGDKNYVNKQGKVQSFKWSGMTTPFTEIVENTKGEPVVSVKAIDIPVGKNPTTGKVETMKGATDDLLSYIISNPKSKLSVYKLWEDEKAKRGVDYSKDPAIEDAMFRNFVYTQAEKLLPHGVVTEEITKTPTINVKVGGGGVPSKTVDYDFIKNIQDSIQNNDVESLTSLADNLAGLRGGKFIYQSVVPYKRKDGTITGVQFNLQDEYGDTVTRTLKSGASNLRAQLVGLYQDITGSSSKAEKSLVGEKPKKETYKVGNQTFSKADLNKKGYTDDQIEQAIKLGNIIKQ